MFITGNDPFAIPGSGGGTHHLELSFTSHDEGSDSDHSMDMDTVNISLGHSDVSLSGLEMELGPGDDKSKPIEPKVDPRPLTPPATESDSSYTSVSTTQETPSSTENILLPIHTAAAQSSPRASSPASPTLQLQSSSPLRRDGEFSSSVERSESANGRMPRINREEVQRRLMKKRSLESPAREAQAELKVDEAPGTEEAGNRMSILTDFDLSTEIATVETVIEKRHVGQTNVAPSVTTQPQSRIQPQSIDLPCTAMGESLTFDMEQFGMGSTVDVDMKSALDRLMDDVAGSVNGDEFERKDRDVGTMKVEAVMEGVQAGRFEVDDSIGTETEEDDTSLDPAIGMGRPPIARAATESGLFVDPGSSLAPISPTTTGPGRTASGSTIPPPPPPKDAIRSREELIIEKRREARRREEDENVGYWTPPRPSEMALGLGKGRPSRRRSRSTGDMEELARRNEKTASSGDGFLNVGGLEEQGEDDLGNSIQRELRKLGAGRSVSVFFP